MIRKTALLCGAITGLSQAALAEGDAAAGEAVFRQCASCHALEEGRNGAGPSLYGIMGATAGQAAGFRYSPAIADSGIVWTDETLAAFVADPRGYIRGNRMGFRGLRDEQDIADLIAYLTEATATQ